MKSKNAFFGFSILVFNIIIPCLNAENILDGNYKSEFLLPFNRAYAGNLKCPKKLPIKVQLTVKGNEIIGNISNSSKCPNYQRAQINGEIDKSGNIVKIKFDHYDKKWGSKEDVYKIEGNLNNKLILKSKQKRMYKDHIFFFNSQNASTKIEKFIDEVDTNNLDIDNDFSYKTKKKSNEDLKEKQITDQQEQKRIKKESNLLFN